MSDQSVILGVCFPDSFAVSWWNFFKNLSVEQLGQRRADLDLGL